MVQSAYDWVVRMFLLWFGHGNLVVGAHHRVVKNSTDCFRVDNLCSQLSRITRAEQFSSKIFCPQLWYAIKNIFLEISSSYYYWCKSRKDSLSKEVGTEG